MTDPKTAARTVAARLAAQAIRIKHVQSLDLVAAGIGVANRDVLATFAELPAIQRVNRALLTSAATVLARHDLARRQTIVDVTSDVLLPGTPIAETQAPRFGERRDGHVVAWLQHPTPSDDVHTLFWSNADGWVHFDSADVFPDRTGDLPLLGLPNPSDVRWLTWEQGRFRSAVDDAVLELDREDPELGFDPDVPGERQLDYDAIALTLHGKGVFHRMVGPIEIAVRDGADRAFIHAPTISDPKDRSGDMVREWVDEVEAAFVDGSAPDEDRMRELLMDGDSAISAIRDRLEADDRLWAWLNVAGYPTAIDNEIVGDAREPEPTVSWLDSRDRTMVRLTPAELARPHLVLQDRGRSKAFVKELTEGTYFSHWESSRSLLEKSTSVEIASAYFEAFRKAKTDEERRLASHVALQSALKPNDPYYEWHVDDQGLDVASRMLDALESAIDDADEQLDGTPFAEAYDRDLWLEAMEDAYVRHIIDEDDSTAFDVVSSRDMVEVFFHIVKPGYEVDDMVSMAGPWPDPKRLCVDDRLQHALAVMGWTIGDFRREIGDQEPSELTGLRPKVRSERMIDAAQLVEIVENACTQYFNFVAYAQVPLTDVLKLDLRKPIAFSNPAIATYSCVSGTFQDVTLKREVVFQDGVDGAFGTTDVGYSPNEICGLTTEPYVSELYDPEVRRMADGATAALDAYLAVDGLVRERPRSREHWTADDDGLVLKAVVGVRDPSRSYRVVDAVATFADMDSASPDVRYETRRK